MSVTLRLLTVATVLVSVGCSASSDSDPQSPSTTGLELADMSTSSTIASTSTTQPPLISNLDVRIDPKSQYLPEVQFILEIVKTTEQLYPVTPGTKVIMFSTSEESYQWVRQTTSETRCHNDKSRSDILNSAGWGHECGFIMRLDAMGYRCGLPGPCPQSRTVAAHEFFHVATNQRLQGCACEPRIFGNKVPNWINEGAAEYVGYAVTYGRQPGSLSQGELGELQRRKIEEFGHSDSFRPSLKELESLWQGNISQSGGNLYSRSFLAVSLLVEKFGEKVVLVDYFDNVARTGHYSTGFRETFGMTETEFNDEFQVWVAAL